jgi:translation elongation factor EF-Tu-like GTPase
MPELLIRIKARLHFLTTKQGGRSTPIFGHDGYQPNHNFFGPDKQEMCLGYIDLAEGEKIWPGDTIERVMTLLILPELKPEIRKGREWRIQEGFRLVGTGTVLEVLDLESKAST